MAKIKVGFGKIYTMAGHFEGIECIGFYDGKYHFKDVVTKKIIVLRTEQVGMLHEKKGVNYHVVNK